MRRIVAFALLASLFLSPAPAALASGAYGKYLPPDQAFRLKATTTASTVVLDWHIAPGYTLYRNKFKIIATHGAIGKALFPAGAMENDPNFGRVEVYWHEVRVTVPYKRAPANGQLVLVVSYQGCIPNGICYPPITKHLDLKVEPGK